MLAVGRDAYVGGRRRSMESSCLEFDLNTEKGKQGMLWGEWQYLI